MNRKLPIWGLLLAAFFLSSCASVHVAQTTNELPPVGDQYLREVPDVSFDGSRAFDSAPEIEAPLILAEPVVGLVDGLSAERPEPEDFPVIGSLDEPRLRLPAVSVQTDDSAAVPGQAELNQLDEGLVEPVLPDQVDALVAENPDQRLPDVPTARSAPQVRESTEPGATIAAPARQPVAVSEPPVSSVAPTEPESTSTQSGVSIVQEPASLPASDPVQTGVILGMEPIRRSSDEREIEILLPGSGWIYVGSEYAAGSIELVSKSRRDGDDLFVFDLSEPGEYGLWFQQQNVANGTFDNRRVVATRTTSAAQGSESSRPVAGNESSGMAAADPESAVRGSAPTSSDSASGGAPDGATGVDYSVAVGLLRAGDIEQAFRALLDESAAFDPSLEALSPETLDEFAAFSRLLPPPAEQSFWNRVARADVPLSATARDRLLESTLAEGDIPGITASAEALVRSGETDADELLSVAREVLALGYEGPAAGLVSHAMAVGLPAGYVRGLDDESLFLLAQQYERIGPNRNLRESLRLYRLITERFPLSQYWERSRERSEHIERHYIDIR